MTHHARGPRRQLRSSRRRVLVFTAPNRGLRPDQVTEIITAASLEQARLEAAAQADTEATTAHLATEDPNA